VARTGLYQRSVRCRLRRRNCDGQCAYRARCLLHPVGPVTAQLGRQFVLPCRLGEAERGKQPGAVVRVVGVGAYPAIGGPPEPGERCESGLGVPVNQQVALAGERGGHCALVDCHSRHGATVASGQQLGSSERAHSDRGPRQLPHGQTGGQPASWSPVGHLCREFGGTTEGGPGGGGSFVGGLVRHGTHSAPTGPLLFVALAVDSFWPAGRSVDTPVARAAT
jgi:hypothetical protein